MFTASGGLSVLAPKITGAHSTVSKVVGGAALAVGAGVGVAVAAPGLLTSIGGGLATTVKTVAGILPAAGKMIGGILPGMLGGKGGGGVPQADPYTQADPYGQAYAAQQAEYARQVAAQQQGMYLPAGYNPNTPYIPDGYASAQVGQPGTFQTSYGDLRSPYTAVSEDGSQQYSVDPVTGKIITAQAGMFPDLSMNTWLLIGGATLVGWYVMSEYKSTN
jgi:hypothetical protein